VLHTEFKHGISETRFESFINIDIKAKEGCLNFEIENTKEACENGSNKTNIGLVNVRRQLELTYSDYKLEVQNNNKSFKVNLLVNLNSYVEI
jgi:LytS/YehU family sensor histidine kinase